MNDHEAQRIAAAMHAARPDWPTASVLTLIRTKLIDRPRRDVFVALAWVASEPATSTPARVLETGPWWRAAAVDGGTVRHSEPAKHERCSVCSLHHDRCRQLHADDHDFHRADHKPELDVATTIAALRAEKQAMREPTPRPTPSTAGSERVAAIRREDNPQ